MEEGEASFPCLPHSVAIAASSGARGVSLGRMVIGGNTT